MRSPRVSLLMPVRNRVHLLDQVLGSLAENIFVTISARALRPDIEIVSRAAEESTEKKLIRAGANDVISPYKASGRAMARIALSARPQVPRDPTGLATPDPEQPVQAGARHDG